VEFLSSVFHGFSLNPAMNGGLMLHPWLSMKGFLSSSIIFSRTKIVRYHHAYAAEDRAPLGSDPSAAAGQTAAGGIRKRVPSVFSILLVAQSDKSRPPPAQTTHLTNNRSCTGSGLALSGGRQLSIRAGADL
jgi:hypothetical protein